MLSPEHTEPSMNKTPIPTFTFYVPNHGKYLCTESSVNRAMSNLNLCSLQGADHLGLEVQSQFTPHRVLSQAWRP